MKLPLILLVVLADGFPAAKRCEDEDVAAPC
jgi:hypothetical protein